MLVQQASPSGNRIAHGWAGCRREKGPRKEKPREPKFPPFHLIRLGLPRIATLVATSGGTMVGRGLIADRTRINRRLVAIAHQSPFS
jgi:hypothetical protein